MASIAKTKDRKNSLIEDFINYDQTVNCLLAFAALVVHDGTSQRAGSCFGFGRRMSTSTKNRMHADDEITPDLVAQMNKKYGVVAEVKRSLGTDRRFWKHILEQLRKYDDELTGWWTSKGTIAEFNAVLLLHHTRSRAFKLFTEEEVRKDPDVFGASSSVVEFNEDTERQVFYRFRLEYGELSDRELAAKLKLGISVPIDRVLETFSNVRFYDAEPPLLVVLVNLWMNYFASKMEPHCFEPERKMWRINVKLDEMLTEIQKAHGSGLLFCDDRSCQFPTKAALRDALEWLEKHKMAERDEKHKMLIILYRKIRGDLKEYFAGQIARDKSQKSTEEQLALFEDIASNDS